MSIRNTLSTLSLILLLVGCSTSTENESPLTKGEVLKNLAKEETLKRLKSPSDAVFFDDLHEVWTLPNLEGDCYSVVIHVDALNGFGAKQRKKYNVSYCSISQDSLSNSNYKLNTFSEI